jgi:hypothetical protein
MNKTILKCIPLLAMWAILGIASGDSYVMPTWADKSADDYDDIKDLSKDIDDGEMDDDSVDWSDFKKSEAFKTADDEIQECIEEAEDLGGNLGDYEILECVDEYD